MTKLTEVTQLVIEAEILGLSMPPAMAHMDLRQIAEVSNGVGPQWAPEWIRDALSTRLRVFLPAALVHDVAYSFISSRDPHADDLRFWADEMFYGNCRTCAAHAAPWYSPRRWILERDAWLAYRAVRKFGGLSLA